SERWGTAFLPGLDSSFSRDVDPRRWVPQQLGDWLLDRGFAEWIVDKIRTREISGDHFINLGYGEIVELCANKDRSKSRDGSDMPWDLSQEIRRLEARSDISRLAPHAPFPRSSVKDSRASQ